MHYAYIQVISISLQHLFINYHFIILFIARMQVINTILMLSCLEFSVYFLGQVTKSIFYVCKNHQNFGKWQLVLTFISHFRCTCQFLREKVITFCHVIWFKIMYVNWNRNWQVLDYILYNSRYFWKNAWQCLSTAALGLEKSLLVPVQSYLFNIYM